MQTADKTHRYNGRKMYNRFGDTSGRIWMDDVRCTGREADIGQCSHRGWGVHNCRHRDDVAVSCYSWTDRNGKYSESRTMSREHNVSQTIIVLLEYVLNTHYYYY